MLDISAKPATIETVARRFQATVCENTNGVKARRAKFVQDSGVFFVPEFFARRIGQVGEQSPTWPGAFTPVFSPLCAAQRTQCENWELSGIQTNLKGDSAMSKKSYTCPSELNRSRFRKAVRPQIKQFRAAHGNPPGKTVDHKHPHTFAKLKADFLQSMGFPPDAKPGRILFEKLKPQWQTYHQQNAVLELVTEEENLLRAGAVIFNKKVSGGGV